MDTHEIVKRALELAPAQRAAVAESILRSLDQPDAALDAIWLDEAERRLAAYRRGLTQGVPAADVVGKL